MHFCLELSLSDEHLPRRAGRGGLVQTCSRISAFLGCLGGVCRSFSTLYDVHPTLSPRTRSTSSQLIHCTVVPIAAKRSSAPGLANRLLDRSGDLWNSKYLLEHEYCKVQQSDQCFCEGPAVSVLMSAPSTLNLFMQQRGALRSALLCGFNLSPHFQPFPSSSGRVRGIWGSTHVPPGRCLAFLVSRIGS